MKRHITIFPDWEKCGGLLHAEHEEEMEDGYLLSYKCDKCGENTSDE